MSVMTPQLQAAAQGALVAFGKAQATLVPIAMGHINVTLEACHPTGAFVLQRVNPMFAPEVNLDIVAIVEHLHRANLLAPDLQRAQDGRFWHPDDSGGIWRLMTKIEGLAVERCTTPAQCHTVGALLGHFHRALWGVQHTFAAPRLGVHDTARHLARLEAALDAHRGHMAFDQVAPLAQAILAAGQRLPPLGLDPERIVHGDPKISNFIFNGQGQAIALIDLDTLANMPLALEVGDALRSWCSPGGEDPRTAGFVLSHFEAAMHGYREGVGDRLTPQEVQHLVPALGTIATELAARFACDALEERYFGWDRGRFAHAWQHNLERAQSQWLLAQSFDAQKHQAARVVGQVFSLTV
jgi:Ser/Thr protein kinase RdoA (MazF antagonist)